MRTTFDFQSKGTYWRVLVTLLPRIRCIAAVSFVLIAVLLTCYSTIANARRDSALDASDEANALPGEEDNDPEYVEKRDEFLNRFFGTEPGDVSPTDYARALAAARTLPPSLLLQGRGFVSPETLEMAAPWTLPISPPIQNSYGGNASARIHALTIDPINPNVVYTGSLGGLAKTTDGGVTWRYLSDAWSSQSISSVAIDPNAHNFLYVGTGRDGYGPYGVGVYRSFDGGETWAGPLGGDEFAGSYLRSIAVDPRISGSPSRTILYAASGLSNNSGLWRSLNSGVTWTRVRQAGYNGIYDLAVDPSTFPSTVYVTEDGGTFKSTNCGASWTLIHGVLTGSHNRLSVVNSTLYLLGPRDADHNFYKSRDRGATWVQIPTNCFAGADSCANTKSIGFGVFAVNSANSQIIIGGNMSLYRTENGGLSWTEIGHWYGPDVHTDQRVIAFSTMAPVIVYDGNDGGIVRSADAGRQWTNLNQNLPGALLYSVALSADGSMIGGTQDNGAVFSNVGAQWKMVMGGDSSHDLIDPIGNTWGYLVGYRRTSFRRFNRETNQTLYISPDQFNQDCACNFFPTFSMNPLAPTHLIAACQQVVRTLNGPTVSHSGWTTIGNGPLPSPAASPCESRGVVTAVSEAPGNSDVIYAVTNYDTVFVTSNADQGNGAVWIPVTQRGHPGGIYAVTADPTNYRTAYLACNSGVYKTTDMGITWTQQGVPNLFYRDVAIDAANPQHIFAASFAGVFASTDGGATWGNMSDGIPAGMAVTGLSFNAMSRQLAASTYGRGVYILDLNVPPTVSMNSSANLATTPEL